MGGKEKEEGETKKLNEMKANSHSQGCGSFVCLFVCFAVSLRSKTKPKKKKKRPKRKSFRTESCSESSESDQLYCWLLFLFIFQQAGASEDDTEDFLARVPATHTTFFFGSPLS